MYRRIRDAAHNLESDLQDWLAAAGLKEWEALAWLVGSQYVPVDLYYHLELTDTLKLAPQAERDFLQSSAVLAADQERKYRADISRVAAALNLHGITATLLKGSALISADYFPRRGQRYIGDIDFIVQPGELDQAVDALERCGYRFEISIPRPIEIYWRSKHDLPSMWHPDGFLRLECHVRPMNRTVLRAAPINSDSLLENAGIVAIEGGRVGIPSPEHLVVHAFYHSQLNDMYELAGTDNYRAMIDVATVVERAGSAFDWQYVKEIIGSIDAHKSFALFIDRIAHCVDSRALEWPVDRINIGFKKHVHTFATQHRRTSLTVYAMGRLAKEIRFGLSRDRRNERRLLREANPGNMSFAPRWRQLLSPTTWRQRARWVFEMTGTPYLTIF